MKIELPSKDHILLLHDYGRRPVELYGEDWFAPEISFPLAKVEDYPAIFDFIGQVHGEEGQTRAMSHPFLRMLHVWPGRLIGTALLRRRWGIPEVAWVTVRKAAYGNGLASAMVQNLVQSCNTRYVCAVTSNPSVVPFWEKCGFHVAEEIPEDK